MMEINFIPTPKFKKSFKRLYEKYHSLKDDFELFKKEFSENQEMGDDLGGGFRKVRMAIETSLGEASRFVELKASLQACNPNQATNDSQTTQPFLL